MSKIALTRIDDRLIHGQVITAWCKITSAKRIVIVDDLVVKDPFIVQVLQMAAPSTVKVEVHDVESGAEVLKSYNGDEKYPKTVLGLVNSGVDLKELNVGGMGAGLGRKSFYKNISVSDEEKEIFRELISKDVKCFIQIVPDAKKIDVGTLL
ncbi:TPA: PTS sugar transporter subunit IIB [Clostridioides difficile]|uniref:PTS system mannose/fructose/N-acetylgalactosamine-transporter subunit IIB n=1 Tax=Clostridioides difficile TaxID=1496 RepID=UPI0010286F8A|nr:PTS sugar transporter subunit IIB [Clostridioides difficile]VFD74088.1 PTS system mannose/fructose/sorbose transporter subunit IIB [Clostridioides difficile]HBF9976834.1 PTS sugar transporter subunit IIB [Clostridioides difficile]HBY3372720.1 PTS sugar transporter subunit IIB [Clostridioides difficile]